MYCRKRPYLEKRFGTSGYLWRAAEIAGVLPQSHRWWVHIKWHTRGGVMLENTFYMHTYTFAFYLIRSLERRYFFALDKEGRSGFIRDIMCQANLTVDSPYYNSLMYRTHWCTELIRSTCTQSEVTMASVLTVGFGLFWRNLSMETANSLVVTSISHPSVIHQSYPIWITHVSG